MVDVRRFSIRKYESLNVIYMVRVASVKKIVKSIHKSFSKIKTKSRTNPMGLVTDYAWRRLHSFESFFYFNVTLINYVCS